MIIKFRKRKYPKLGETRIKKEFILFRRDNNVGYIICHTLYKKQILKCTYGYDERYYEDACKQASEGIIPNKKYLKMVKWYTDKVYLSKREAFLEEL